MIPEEIVQKVLDVTDIVDVIGEFVNLHKAGTNYKGLCPFHNEKTPSFVVSPQKQIFKCFGCGESGNAVGFLMKHEQMSFPEAIKWLAKKYGIEYEEKELTPEDLERQKEREALEIIHLFAQKHFSKNLFQTEEGRNIGLSYFEMRGFTAETINKFQLGYAMRSRTDLLNAAKEKGYKPEMLEKAGLVGKKDNNINPFGNKDRYYDRFAGRVIFPIHSISGKVIAFGGRILTNDKKTAKYINSPETEIYNKSRTLYGLYFAKKQIIKQDKCYLVEGYTDVISMHQAGIENVVASAGTSLTTDQIRIIHRFTENLTLLFDGDQAGLKAGLRGLDLVLQENMNVRLVILPEGEDPDSFSKNKPFAELKEYLETNEKDFIFFKIDLLKGVNLHDPIKKSQAIKNILTSIAVIPDEIKRSAYIKETARLLETQEQVLVNEINKILKEKAKKEFKQHKQEERRIEKLKKQTPQIPSFVEEQALPEEKELTELLIKFGDKPITIVIKDDESGKEETYETTTARYIINEISNEGGFKHFVYADIFEKIKDMVETTGEIDIEVLQNSEDEQIRDTISKIVSKEYKLSNFWTNQGATVITPEDTYQKAAQRAVISFKIKLIDNFLKKINEELKEDDLDEETKISKLNNLQIILNARKELYKHIGNRHKFDI